jgi:hypothetical protein
VPQRSSMGASGYRWFGETAGRRPSSSHSWVDAEGDSDGGPKAVTPSPTARLPRYREFTGQLRLARRQLDPRFRFLQNLLHCNRMVSS